MIKVLYVLQSYPEASETYIEVERRQVETRAETFALAISRPGTFNLEHLPFQRLPARLPILPIAVPSRWALGLDRAARAYQPDVIHSHWLFVAKHARRAARACDVPWTVRTHSFDLLEATPEAVRANVAICNDSDCAGVIAFPFARSLLLNAGLKEEKLIDAPPVVDVQRFDDPGPNGPGVIYMGANKAKKNFPDFLRLSNLVPERPFNLYPLADGWETLRDLNTEMGTRVTVHDPVPHSDMLAVWKRQSWLVYTGSKELASIGWPIAVVEAWAAGVGVCMQRIRADLEVYLDGCGFLFNEIEELATLIAKDPPEELRQRAHARAKTLDIRRHMYLLYDAWAKAGVNIASQTRGPAT